MEMEQRECYVMSAYRIQMPGNHPEERIQHSEQGESLKSKKRREDFFRTCLILAFVLKM